MSLRCDCRSHASQKKHSAAAHVAGCADKDRICIPFSMGQRLDYRPKETTYFLRRETLVATEKDGLSPLRGEVFAGWLVTLTARQSSFAYRPDCVIEIGTQVEL